jgi:hypothetical protein
MNRWTLLAITLILGTIVSFAAEPEREMSRDKQREEAMRDIELRERSLQVQKHESEIYFENEMRKMQLEQKKIEMEHAKQMGPPPASCPMGPGDWNRGGPGRGHCPAMPLLVLICIAVNILAAVWVAQDIRKRNMGSRLWVAIVVLSGLFGAAVYALIRIGDRST